MFFTLIAVNREEWLGNQAKVFCCVFSLAILRVDTVQNLAKGKTVVLCAYTTNQ